MTEVPRVRLGEHRRIRQLAPPPTEADRQLADRLQSASMLTVRWLINGEVEVVSGSWVGVVRFSGLDIAVEPKLVGGKLRVLRMLEYASGIDLLRRLPADRDLLAKGSDLFELICLLLVREAEWVLRDGMLRDYRGEEATLGVMRGRLRPRDQYLRRFGRIDQLECSYDEYDADVPENQFLAAALTRAARRSANPKLRWALAGLQATFAEACSPPSASADYYRTRITYGRRNDRYQRATSCRASCWTGSRSRTSTTRAQVDALRSCST